MTPTSTPTSTASESSAPAPTCRRRRARRAVVTAACSLALAVGLTAPTTAGAATQPTPSPVGVASALSYVPLGQRCAIVSALRPGLADAVRHQAVSLPGATPDPARACRGAVDLIRLSRAILTIPVSERGLVTRGLTDAAIWGLGVMQFTANLGPYF
jgi:hypothetical protein